MSSMFRSSKARSSKARSSKSKYPKLEDIPEKKFNLSGLSHKTTFLPSHSAAFELTLEEEEEMYARPISSTPHFTRRQLVTRTAIAEKLNNAIYKDALVNAPEFAYLYKRFPIHKFYTSSKNKHTMRRIFGYCKYDDGTFGAYAISALPTGNARIMDGVPLNVLVPLDEWDILHNVFLHNIRAKVLGNYLFSDPLGIIDLMYH
jgi:hypothetical protein